MKRFDFVCLGVCIYEMMTGEYADDENQNFVDFVNQLKLKKIAVK
jgi:hypothetical protein